MKIIHPKLTIYEVEDFHKELLALIDEEGDITLDFGSVERIDMTVVQLLISMEKTCRKMKRNISFTNISKNVHDTFVLSGSNTVLGV